MKADNGENNVKLLTASKVFEFPTILIWVRNLSFYRGAWVLNENNCLVNDETHICEILNDFFCNVTKHI